MRPIPRGMLNHTAQLMQDTGDGYHGEALTPVATLTRVHVAVSVNEAEGRTDTRTEYKGLLMYDARNSLPRGVEFAPGQRVVYSGTVYRVEAVQPLYDGQRLHHVELTLRG